MAESSPLSVLVTKYRISRSSLAATMDVSIQTIHNWCSGRVPVPIHQFERLVTRMRRAGAADLELEQLIALQLESHGLSSSLVAALSIKSAEQTRLGSVMLVAWDLKSGGLFPHFAHSCREAIESMGYTCLVVDCGGDHSLKHTYAKEALRQGYTGVVLIGVPGAFPNPDDDLLSMINPLAKSEIPVVMITPWRAHLPLPAGIAGVGWDSDATNEKALETLFALGHEDIAILLSAAGPLVTGRNQGIEKAFEGLGQTMRNDLVVRVDGDDDDIPETHRVIQSATAVYARASTLATLTNACYTQGLTWPRDISVITVAHSQASLQLGTHPFTYVSVPVRRISHGAAHLLVSLAAGDQAPYSQQFIMYGSSSMRLIHEKDGSIGIPNTQRSTRPLDIIISS